MSEQATPYPTDEQTSPDADAFDEETPDTDEDLQGEGEGEDEGAQQEGEPEPQAGFTSSQVVDGLSPGTAVRSQQ